MKGYEWGKGTVTCSFCHRPGHNIASCSAVQRLYEQYCKNLEAIPNYQGTKSEIKALEQILNREIKAVKKPKPRRKSRCSYCNSIKHKRNHCPKLVKFKKKVQLANENWRRNFVKEININGFGIGSLVNVPMAMVTYQAEDRNGIGLVSGFDKNKLTVFSSYRHGGEFSSTSSIEILIEGQVVSCLVSRLKASWSDKLIPNSSGWKYYEVTSIKADTAELPDEWYQDTDDEQVMKWFFDNISIKSRDFPLLLELINKWT